MAENKLPDNFKSIAYSAEEITEMLNSLQEHLNNLEKTFNGDYNSLINKPEIPTVESLTKESLGVTGLATKKYIEEELRDLKDEILEIVDDDLSNKVDKRGSFSLIEDVELGRRLDFELERFDKIKDYSDDWNNWIEVIEERMDGKANVNDIKREYYTRTETNYKIQKDLKEGLKGKVNIREGYSLVSDSEIAKLGTLKNHSEYITRFNEIDKSINDSVSTINTLKSQVDKIVNSGSANHVHDNKTALDALTMDHINKISSIKKEIKWNEITGKPLIPIMDSKTNSLPSGENTIASGVYSHAEGKDTQAKGEYSHAEGFASHTNENASYSHAEGHETATIAFGSHTEGHNTTTEGIYSHAEGEGTIARGYAQHVYGKYNKLDDDDKYIAIAGNGTDIDYDHRTNAYTLDWEGNGWFAGNVSVGTDNNRLATEKFVNELINTILKFDDNGNLTVTLNGKTKKYKPM